MKKARIIKYKIEGAYMMTKCRYGRKIGFIDIVNVGSLICNMCEHNIMTDSAQRLVLCAHPPIKKT